MKLDALVLIVKDIKAQTRFYTDVLGLSIEADYGDAVFLTMGDQKIALFAHSHHEEGTKRLEGAKKGISHLEFGVSAKEEETLKKKLTKNGFHAYGDNYQDADGNLFHFNIK